MMKNRKLKVDYIVFVQSENKTSKTKVKLENHVKQITKVF